MKTKIILVSIIFIITGSLLHAQSISINSTYTEYSTYDFSNISNLFSVSIDGSVQWIDNDKPGVARVVLVDENFEEYLIAEVNKRFSNDTILNNSSDETLILGNVKPAFIKIIPNNAKVTISSIHYTEYPNKSQGGNRNLVSRSTLLRERINRDVDNWNRYNAEHHKHWIAAVNDSNEYSYQNIKSIFYCDQDDYVSNGIEYYGGGIFEFEDEMKIDNIQDHDNLREVTTNQYVSEFDWRNRHGKNWITSVKNQTYPVQPDTLGNGGCWAFAPIASVEALVNLYYNKNLNYDLSEQEVGVCVGGYNTLRGGRRFDNDYIGGSPGSALNYIKQHGVVPEDCFVFQNNCNVSCNEKCTSPEDIISFNSYSDVYPLTITNIKKSLIENGPIISGISHKTSATTSCGHSMCLVGYKVVEIGDTITYIPSYTPPYTQCAIDSIIRPGDPLIGQTYWIFKNSYGVNGRINKGYMLAVFPQNGDYLYNMTNTHKINMPIKSLNYTDADIAVTDDDNDGYYFWGLGLKPSHCPVCCPDIPDGDDSDPTKAEMDEYGFFSTYQFPYQDIVLTNQTQTWQQDTTICGNIILNNSTLLLNNSTLTHNPAATITVNSNSMLIVNGATMENANIHVNASGKLYLINGAVLKLRSYDNLQIDLGGELNQYESQILIE